MSFLPHLHHHQVNFAKVDPLGDGLGDEIDAERSEDGSIDLREQFDPDLGNRWDQIMQDVRKDPKWFDFTEDE